MAKVLKALEVATSWGSGYKTSPRYHRHTHHGSLSGLDSGDRLAYDGKTPFLGKECEKGFLFEVGAVALRSWTPVIGLTVSS